MGNIQFYNNHILWVGNQIAMAPACCNALGQDCSYCSCGFPNSLRVDISGVANGNSSDPYDNCTECDPNANDSFILDDPTGFGGCGLKYTFPTPWCDEGLYYGPILALQARIITGNVLIVEFITIQQPVFQWSNDYDDPPDCMSWEDEAVSPAGAEYCDNSASTCLITALS